MPEKKAAPTHAKNRDMTAAKVAFVEWLVAVHPEHPTQTALAEHLGVDAATLSDWKRDPLVVRLLKEWEDAREAGWARIYANLERIATQRQDMAAAVSAAREVGKLLKKYPSEKHELTVVDRVAYVQPGALREAAVVALERPN